MNTPKRLLIVASPESFLRVLRFYFTGAGYEVDSAQTADAALRLTADHRIDAVLCDETLGSMDGLQFVRQLRASPLTVHTPVLVLSAGGPERIRSARGVGASDVIRRDSKIELIGESLARLVSNVDAVDRPARAPGAAHTVTILGARGGSGKTFLATSLAVALAQRPSETAVLVDMNLEFGTTAMMLDLRPMYTLRDVAEAVLSGVSDIEFDAMLLRHPSGLRVVPAVARPGDSELIPEGGLNQVMQRLQRLYDHVVIDGRPSFREFMLDLWESSDTLLVACPPEVISILVTRSLLEAFQVVNIQPGKILIVMNQVAAKARLTAAQVEKGLGRTTFSIPHGGEAVSRSADVGRSFLLDHPNEATSHAIRNLAEALVARYRGVHRHET